jgi:ATP-dependent Clp protease ATP-binding subunit ClpB
VYGARPLKRVVRKEVEDALAKALLTGKILDGQEVVVDLAAGGFEVAGRPRG